jgi:predicted DNA-binding transcriptional regulator YafY
MAKKRSEPRAPSVSAVTAERAARLYRLLNLLGHGAQTRSAFTRKLKLGVRGFYRDLEVLRDVGIAVDLVNGRYVLLENLGEAVERLPFPDPGLTLGEARMLAKGRSRAHRKLKSQLEAIVK